MAVEADLVSCLIALRREEKVFGPGRKCLCLGNAKRVLGRVERAGLSILGGGGGNLNLERARPCAELEPGTEGGECGVAASAGIMTV